MIPYTAKLLRGKTFAVVHKTHYSLENFCCASGRGHHVLYTANDSREKLSRLARKLRKFSPSKVSPYTVCQKVANRPLKFFRHGFQKFSQVASLTIPSIEICVHKALLNSSRFILVHFSLLIEILILIF